MTTTLQDAIVALLITVGVAVAISIAFALAGAFFSRTTAREARSIRDAGPVQHPTQTDDVRELVLR